LTALLNLAATPHPAGNRIDLSWTPPEGFDGVSVVRREGTYPAAPGDGVEVTEQPAAGLATDRKLSGETVYYYRLYPFRGGDTSPRVFDDDPENRASAMATSTAGLAEEMYRLLPAIYRRFDETAALRGFLELPGGQLDQLYSYATAALGLHDVRRIDGALLPLLADWIGWNTSRGLPLEQQRGEVRHAPALYQATGLIPVIGATVQRIAKVRSRVKEFVHNVALTNNPERLNLWQLTRTGTQWQDAQLVALESAPGGRASIAAAGTATAIFYERDDDGRYSIWTRTLPPQSAALPQPAAEDPGWSESTRLSPGTSRYRHPSAVARDSSVAVFWSAYDPGGRSWTIESRTFSDQQWSPAVTFVPPEGNPAANRRKPVAVADGSGIWLFWHEQVGTNWILKYNRHDGNGWQANPSPSVWPEAQPRLDDVFLLFHPDDAARPLWLFWAAPEPVLTPGQDPSLPHQSSWTVSFRVKNSTDPGRADWDTVQPMPKPEGDHEDDREPCARLDGDNLEVIWSSHRGGHWGIWQRGLDHVTQAWSAPGQLPAQAGSMRAPVAFARGDDTVVVIRSSEPVLYTSPNYSATETLDSRYAGSLTTDTADAALRAARGSFDDLGSYLYDTGRTDDDRYARDTIGVYVPAGSDTRRAARVLREFMPLTDRAVFIEEASP
jgi:hypothetical protein